jgi:hypothetical protein
MGKPNPIGKTHPKACYRKLILRNNTLSLTPPRTGATAHKFEELVLVSPCSLLTTIWLWKHLLEKLCTQIAIPLQSWVKDHDHLPVTGHFHICQSCIQIVILLYAKSSLTSYPSHICQSCIQIVILLCARLSLTAYPSHICQSCIQKVILLCARSSLTSYPCHNLVSPVFR